MLDILEKVPEKTIKCLDKGIVELIDVMPRLVPDGMTADYAIAQMARTSYGKGTKSVSDDENLINYLLRSQHTSPIEAVEFKFYLKIPIFCARQWMRHRAASVCEYSGRFSQMKDDFYIPKTNNVRKQSVINKQSSDCPVDEVLAEDFINTLENYCDETYKDYEKYLKEGICREQARMMLPVNLYTEFYWKQDLHNLLHLISLRSDHHSQQEIKVYSDAILKLIEPIVPITIKAFDKYHPLRNAIKFTSLEVDALKEYFQTNNKDSLKIKSDNKRENSEWKDKLVKLGVIDD